MASSSNNTGEPVRGIKYAKSRDAKETMTVFDSLSPEVRRAITMMPARANVHGYARIEKQFGTMAALKHIERAINDFIAAAGGPGAEKIEEKLASPQDTQPSASDAS